VIAGAVPQADTSQW